jgi:hypothetical protein
MDPKIVKRIATLKDIIARDTTNPNERIAAQSRLDSIIAKYGEPPSPSFPSQSYFVGGIYEPRPYMRPATATVKVDIARMMRETIQAKMAEKAAYAMAQSSEAVQAAHWLIFDYGLEIEPHESGWLVTDEQGIKRLMTGERIVEYAREQGWSD